MKKLSKKQKTGLLIGGGVLAVLALSSFAPKPGTPEKPKIEITGLDPDKLHVHYTLNGTPRRAPINYTQAFPITQGFGIRTERAVYGNMRFLHTFNNAVVAELASVDVSQYHYEPAPAPAPATSTKR